MVVDRKILNKWKIKKTTQKDIAEKTGLAENTVSRAFSGRASKDTIAAIENYFRSRK